MKIIKGDICMYNNERVIIDTRKYDIEEILFRYEHGKIIFYEKKATTWKRREKIIQDVTEALLRGIPFPPVYASELQTGELLILDKSDKLRFLLEYFAHWNALNNKSVNRDRYLERTILYSTVILYVIDYMNPRYMHMQVGKFVEEWTAMQEQSVWNVLYQGDSIKALEYMTGEGRNSRFIKLNLQYYLMHYLMVDFVADNLLNEFDQIQAARVRPHEIPDIGNDGSSLRHLEREMEFDAGSCYYSVCTVSWNCIWFYCFYKNHCNPAI